jgi:ribosomal protein L29
MTRKDLDNMTPDEVRETLDRLRKRYAELLKGQEMTYENLVSLHPDELREVKQCVATELSILKGEPVQPPQAEPEPEPAKPAKGAKMTKRMRQRIERFDAMSDADQVDSLRGLWGTHD